MHGESPMNPPAASAVARLLRATLPLAFVALGGVSASADEGPPAAAPPPAKLAPEAGLALPAELLTLPGASEDAPVLAAPGETPAVPTLAAAAAPRSGRTQLAVDGKRGQPEVRSPALASGERDLAVMLRLEVPF